MPSPTRAQLRHRLEKSRASEEQAWSQADHWQNEAVTKAAQLKAAASACRHILDLHGGSCTCETCKGARYALGMPSLVEQRALAFGG